jgi:hypothetical protein
MKPLVADDDAMDVRRVAPAGLTEARTTGAMEAAKAAMMLCFTCRASERRARASVKRSTSDARRRRRRNAT